MKIEEEIELLKEQMKIDKDYFFQHPEPGLNEIETSQYIIKRLKEIGYTDVQTSIYETGILATLTGRTLGPCILFRSEMDAVIMDETGRTKHSCGHHAHMAILLAFAQILIQNQDKICGTVKLLFQPDEEGSGGANPMIKAGVLENPKVDKVFAVHVWSELKEDTIAIKEGAVMASTDPFQITVLGKGGHAAIPEKCIDTVYIANKIGMAIKEMAVLDANEDNKVVLGITAITGGKNNNVIPNKVYLKGICRTFDNELREIVKKKLVEKVEKIAKEMGGEAKLEFTGNYPATINSEKEAREVQEIAEKIVENVVIDYRTMCSEDFSYFLEKVPGAMIFVGCQQDTYYPQHNENFTVGMNPVMIGTQIFYEIAKKYLIK